MPPQRERSVGRYVLADEIGCGGMGTVHLGHLDGPGGFSRTVAIKRLHPHLAKDPEFAAMLLDEARVAARIAHPNVVATLDVIHEAGELLIVMEYVHGDSLSHLRRAAGAMAQPIPVAVAIAVAVVTDVLHGLHAAHEATGPRGASLDVVHRDVSPQNIVVGRDGIARVLDFGVAKASSRIYATRDGQIKGKLAYMAPEQLARGSIDRRVDVFAASVVLWEALTGARLFAAESEAETVTRTLSAPIPAPSTLRPELSRALDDLVLRGLARDPSQRFSTAREMATALERTRLAASRADVGTWVELTAGPSLATRSASVQSLERTLSEGASGPSASESAIATDRIGSTLASAPPPRRKVTPPPSSRRRGRIALVSGAVVLVASLLGVRAYRTSAIARADARAVAARLETDSAASASHPAPPNDFTATSAPTPPTDTASVPAPRSSARSRPPGVRLANPTGARAGARSAASCDPPYYFEPDGAKHLKAECLR